MKHVGRTIRIVWTEEANIDLMRIKKFFVSQRQYILKKFTKKLNETIRRMYKFPLQGAAVLSRDNVYTLFFLFGAHGGYNIKYAIYGKQIIILNIKHSKENN